MFDDLAGNMVFDDLAGNMVFDDLAGNMVFDVNILLGSRHVKCKTAFCS